MVDYKLFERWVKNAIKNKFVFKTYEEYYIVTDGYTAFKISNKLSNFERVLKEQTFQDLTKDFKIYNRKITVKQQSNFEEFFKIEDKIKAEKLPFIYDSCYIMRIFKTEKDLIFVKEELLKNIQLYNFEAYAGSPIDSIVFYSKLLQYVALPVKMMQFDYEINNKVDVNE